MRLPVATAALMVSSIAVLAQKNDLSFTAGSILTSDQRTTNSVSCPPIIPCVRSISTVFVYRTDPGVATEVTYARRFANFGPASLQLELPVIGVPRRDVPASFVIGVGTGTVSGLSASSVYLTPSVKVKFLNAAAISPFVSVGGGLAHSTVNFNVFGFKLSGGATASSNRAALQFGGGADIKSPIPHLGFRAEARDFYSGSNIQPSPFPLHISPKYLHHVFAGGGVVLKF